VLKRIQVNKYSSIGFTTSTRSGIETILIIISPDATGAIGLQSLRLSSIHKLIVVLMLIGKRLFTYRHKASLLQLRK
jgi:hypothetical protein